MKKIYLLFLLFALIASSSLQAGIPKDLIKPFLIQEPEVPTQGYAFKLMNPEGNPVELKDYEGQILLLNFWATWCVPCIRELPDFQELQSKLENEDFSILGINVMDSQKRVDRFIQDRKLTLPVAMDLKGDTYPRYKVQNFPTTIIIDKKGREIGRVVGIRSWASLESIRFFRNLSKKL